MAIDVLVIGLRNVAGIQGGIEAHVRNLATELDRLGVKVAVCVRSPYAPAGQTLPGTQIDIVRLWAPRWPAAEALLHTLLCLVYAAFTRPRLVHIHAVGPSVMVPVARLFGLKVVTTHHGEDYRREKWGPVARVLLRAGELFQARLAQRTLCVCQSLAARLSQHYRRNFSYIPNGVVRPRALASTAVLRELCLQPGAYVLTVSRLVPEKRHLDLIDAFSRAAHGGAQLVIVGVADRKSAAYERKVRRAAAQTPGVVLAGFRNGTELQALYENAALFVLPSSHEGMPIALLEAMAHGCQVLVSALPAHLDLALGAAHYHDVGDMADLAAKMTALLTQTGSRVPDWDDKLREFRWATIALQTRDAYRDVVPELGAATVPSPAATETPGS